MLNFSLGLGNCCVFTPISSFWLWPFIQLQDTPTNPTSTPLVFLLCVYKTVSFG